MLHDAFGFRMQPAFKDFFGKKDFSFYSKTVPLVWCSVIACLSFGVAVIANVPSLYRDVLDCLGEPDTYPNRAFYAKVCKSSKLYTSYEKYSETSANSSIQTNRVRVIHKIPYLEDIPYIVIFVCFSYCFGVVFDYLENGRLKSVLEYPRHEVSKEKTASILKDLELFVSTNTGCDSHYALVLFCEAAQLLTLVLQFELVDIWLERAFHLFAREYFHFIGVISGPKETRSKSPIDIYFPTVVSCQYEEFYGSGGEITVNNVQTKFTASLLFETKA